MKIPTSPSVFPVLIAVALSIAATRPVYANSSGAENANSPDVLTPAQAGRIFLANAADFVDEQAVTSNRLAGRTITADFADGNFRMRHVFHEDGRSITWEALTGFEKGNTGTVPYQAFDLRPGITYVMLRPQDNEAVALVIDDNRGSAAGFLAISEAGANKENISLKRLEGKILESDLEGSPPYFHPVTDLSGTRFTVVYPNEVAIYEHIYLNPNYMTWLGKKGTSAGVADTERYHAMEVAPQLYLVAWSEKSAPLQISLLLDFENRTELGHIFGHDENQDRNVYQTTSARITEIMHSRIEGLK